MHLFVKVYSPIYNVHTFLYWGCVLTSKTLNFITFHYTIRSIWTPYIPYESYTLLFIVRISNTFLILIVQGRPFTCLFKNRTGLFYFLKAYYTHTFQISTGLFYFSEGLLHIPISDYYRPVLIFRRSITHTHFTLLQACSIFK